MTFSQKILVFIFSYIIFSFSFAVSSIDLANAQTGCPVIPTSPDSVTTTVTIGQSGTYVIWSRLLFPDTTNNSYFLQIDDGCAINIGDAATNPVNRWTWINYQDGNTTSITSIPLTAGDHILKLTEREGGVGIDRLIFTTDTTCIPSDFGDNCPVPTGIPTILPTNTVVPIPTATTVPPIPTVTKIPTATLTPKPTLRPTALPTPIPAMTVSNIGMSFTKSGTNRNVKTVVTVKKEAAGTVLSGVTVSMNLRTPKGTVYNFSGTTDKKGQVTFTKQSKELGIYLATVTNVTKSGYIYHPTNTVASLNVK